MFNWSVTPAGACWERPETCADKLKHSRAQDMSEYELESPTGSASTGLCAPCLKPSADDKFGQVCALRSRLLGLFECSLVHVVSVCQLSGLVGRKVRFGSLAGCVDAACGRTVGAAKPAWLIPGGWPCVIRMQYQSNETERASRKHFERQRSTARHVTPSHPSINPSIHPFVRPSICPSAHPSVRPSPSITIHPSRRYTPFSKLLYTPFYKPLT